MEQSLPSIHYRRRWYYALWVLLLGLSLAAKLLWETPASTGLAFLAVRLEIRDLPAGSRARVWAGPLQQWPGASWRGEGAVQEQTEGPGGISIPRLLLPVGYRRWVRKDYIPRRTADFVVFQLVPPSGPSRYLAFLLKDDWRTGLLRPGRHLALNLDCRWSDLTADPALPQVPRP